MPMTNSNHYFYNGGEICKLDTALYNSTASFYRVFIKEGKEIPSSLVDGLVLFHKHSIQAEVDKAPEEEMNSFYEWWDGYVRVQKDNLDMPRQLIGKFISSEDRIRDALITRDNSKLQRHRALRSARDDFIKLCFINRAKREGREPHSVHKDNKWVDDKLKSGVEEFRASVSRIKGSRDK